MKTAGVLGSWSAPRFLSLRGILLCQFPAVELCHTTHMLYSIGYLLIRRHARVCLKHEKKKTDCEARFWCLKLESFLAGKYLIKSVNN